MSSVLLLPLLIMLGVIAIFALVGGILLVAFKARPEQPGWAPAGPPGSQPPGSQPPGVSWPGHPPAGPFVGVWNAEIMGNGAFGVIGRNFGTFRLENGVLSFTPDDASVPQWSYPCQHLAAGRRTFFALDGADVRLIGPMGELLCSVSTERINRFSENTAKDFRERQYAEQFVGLLHAHGAGVAH